MPGRINGSFLSLVQQITLQIIFLWKLSKGLLIQDVLPLMVSIHLHLSHVTKKPVFGGLQPGKTNRPAQLERLATALEFLI